MLYHLKLLENTVYSNPVPHLRSRHAKFPGAAKLHSGEILVLCEIGEAFESADSKTYVVRSSDNGNTWNFQGGLYSYSGICNYSESLKPTVLKDGRIIAVGYRFDRSNPDLPIGNPQTGGLLPGKNVVSFSNDEGRTWSVPTVIETEYPELLEVSGPCVQLASGELLAIGSPFKMWNGSNPTGQCGILLRSNDLGKTWDCKTKFFDFNGITPWESRICQMSDGTLVIISWCYDLKKGENLPNHVVFSHDNGHTWSNPIDTKIMAQASNLLPFGDNKLLTIHAHRSGEIGLALRLIDISNDKWYVLEETFIWGNVPKVNSSGNIIQQFASLKFGQPSLLRISSKELLAFFWCIEDCIYKIKAIRIEFVGVL